MQATIHGSLLRDGELLLGGPWTVESTDRGWTASAQLGRQTLIQGAPTAGIYEFRIAGDPTPYEIELELRGAAEETELRVQGRGLKPTVVDDSGSSDRHVHDS